MSARRNITRQQLLLTASVSAFLMSGCYIAAASDADRPLVWIDLGWQYDRLSGMGSIHEPPFLSASSWASDPFDTAARTQRLNLFSYGADGEISFEPAGTDWVITAAVRYGRAHGHRNVQQQSPQALYYSRPPFTGTLRPPPKFLRTVTGDQETHEIIDFQAGKDMGLGLLGNNSTSVVSGGIRFAQFKSKSAAAVDGDPDSHVRYKYFHAFHASEPAYLSYHVYAATSRNERSFRGLGPSLSWNASSSVAGNLADGEISLDWGVNAAVLFGKQKAKVHYQTHGTYHHGFRGIKYSTYHHTPPDQSRERSVTVPNLGGYAGFSYRFSNAKLSLGYRADFFFNAIDGGIDARKSESRGFLGPYASISIGVGD